MASSIWKSGQSAKPSIFHQIILKFYHWRVVLSIIFVLIASTSTMYFYLNKKYILDGPFDVSGPKELSQSEKVTIRLIAPPIQEDLVKFVGHYSICPVVDRIIILWYSSTDFPKDDTFHYVTTHSKVVFERIDKNSFWAEYLNYDNINTPGVFLVDAKTLISCEHLLFGNSVWQSSIDALVGITPNLVESDPLKSNKLVIHPSKTITWANYYNIVLWDGIFVNKRTLQKLKDSNDLQNSFYSGQVCVDFLVPFFVLKESNTPPIWVDVDINSDTKGDLFPISRLLKERFGVEVANVDDCVTKTMELLKITELFRSYAKTNMAKDFLVW